MLTGKELGVAIRAALDKKIDKGDIASYAGAARALEVKPPSVQDWMNKGTISKDTLQELWRFCSDVVGPEHWGLEAYPWGRIAPTTPKVTPIPKNSFSTDELPRINFDKVHRLSLADKLLLQGAWLAAAAAAGIDVDHVRNRKRA